jgi:hypothetical protein
MFLKQCIGGVFGEVIAHDSNKQRADLKKECLDFLKTWSWKESNKSVFRVKLYCLELAFSTMINSLCAYYFVLIKVITN